MLFSITPADFDRATTQCERAFPSLGNSQCRDAIAGMAGYRNWEDLCSNPNMSGAPALPLSATLNELAFCVFLDRAEVTALMVQTLGVLEALDSNCPSLQGFDPSLNVARLLIRLGLAGSAERGRATGVDLPGTGVFFAAVADPQFGLGELEAGGNCGEYGPMVSTLEGDEDLEGAGIVLAHRLQPGDALPCKVDEWLRDTDCATADEKARFRRLLVDVGGGEVPRLQVNPSGAVALTRQYRGLVVAEATSGETHAALIFDLNLSAHQYLDMAVVEVRIHEGVFEPTIDPTSAFASAIQGIVEEAASALASCMLATHSARLEIKVELDARQLPCRNYEVSQEIAQTLCAFVCDSESMGFPWQEYEEDAGMHFRRGKNIPPDEAS